MLKVYLEREGHNYIKTTIHKYMNKKLKLKSIVRRKKQAYMRQEPHKIYGNKLNREFRASRMNEKWCTDFKVYVEIGWIQNWQREQ